MFHRIRRAKNGDEAISERGGVKDWVNKWMRSQLCIYLFFLSENHKSGGILFRIHCHGNCRGELVNSKFGAYSFMKWLDYFFSFGLWNGGFFRTKSLSVSHCSSVGSNPTLLISFVYYAKMVGSINHLKWNSGVNLPQNSNDHGKFTPEIHFWRKSMEAEKILNAKNRHSHLLLRR